MTLIIDIAGALAAAFTFYTGTAALAQGLGLDGTRRRSFRMGVVSVSLATALTVAVVS